MDHIILPGNYATKLNSWQRQGVAAFPGFAVFREVGFATLPKGADNALATIPFTVPSPDLRAGDKPRLDRPLVLPKGAIALGLSLAVFNRGYFIANSSGFTPQLIDRIQAGSNQVVGDGRTGILRKGSATGAFLKAASSLAATDTNGRFADKVVFSSTDLAIGHAANATDGIEIVLPAATAAVAGTKNLFRTTDIHTRFQERTLVYPYDASAPLVVQSAASPISLYSTSAAAGVAAGAPIYSAQDNFSTIHVLAELIYATPDHGPLLDEVALPYSIYAGQTRAA